jgi:hypothetical protein
MNLRWAHTNEVFASGIAPCMGRHCDLGHITDPSAQHEVDETLPNVQGGKTVLSLKLNVTGHWFSDEAQMLSKGLGLKLSNS